MFGSRRRREMGVVWWLPRTLLVLTASVVVPCWGALKYEAPEDCTWGWRDEQAGKVALHCQLRTINNDFDRTNFSLAQSDHTASLRLQCSDVLFFESSLRTAGFQKLSSLEELDIEFCKIRSVPSGAFHGLRELKRLSLRTHNADWSAMAMELHPESMSGLRELQRLNLAENNIWTLPPDVFCELHNLQVLNLTRNHLQDLAELGFAHLEQQQQDGGSVGGNNRKCHLDVKTLDLSRNDYVNLPPYVLTKLKRLQQLHLQNNEISSVADLAFSGMGSLRLLNLSSNQLVALPPELFLSSRELREIYLQNNSISVLAPGLFESLDQLLVLDLSSNALTSTWVHKDTFKGLIRLILLNLAHNSLTRLDPNTFKDLYSLQILNLEYNNIQSIEDNTFLPLYNLHTLVLAHNNLVLVDALDFNGLYVLSRLALDHNSIAGIHDLAFRNCSNLQDLSLSGNVLTQVPEAISDLQFLQTLDLGENIISSISQGALRGLPQLTGLRLVTNRLVTLDRGALGSLPALRVLNLAHNGLKMIEARALEESCPQLQMLRLDANALEEVSLHALPHLLWLNLSSNKLASFRYSYLPHNLEWLDLSRNQISQLGNYFDTQHRLRIKSLDVSFNRLTSISDEALPDSLEVLFINNNLVSQVAPNTFLRKVNLSRVDLYANQLEKLELEALRLSPVPENRALPEFYIGGNPFHCDCSMEWLQRINKMSHLRQHPKVMDLENVMCRLTHTRSRTHIPLIETHSSNFLCIYDAHCFALCHCCDFDACDCEMTCPANCTCYHDQTWSANIVACGNDAYQMIPARIPMDATEVYLDGNTIKVLKSHAFIGRKNMKALYLNGSHVEMIENKTFNGLNSLQELHLEDNYIRELSGSEFEQLSHLRELYLHNNRLTFISNITFLGLKSLEILRLDGNNLANYPVWFLSLNSYLVQVSLSQNKWSCECKYLHELYLWVHENGKKVSDSQEMQCYNNRSGVYEGYLRDYNRTCRGYPVMRNMVMGDYLPVMASVLTISMVALVVVVVVFLYRKELRVCLYTHFGVRLFQKTVVEAEDSDKLFDAYLCYSAKDEDWVTQVLAAELENGNPSFQLWLQYRDAPKSAFSADATVRAVETSRRVIMVLSHNFLQTEWTRFEFKSALHQALKERKRTLIIVALEQIFAPELDPDMILYMKTSTFVTWEERRFWEKLRYALPDKSARANYQRNISSFSVDSQTQQQQSKTLEVAVNNKEAQSNHNHHHHHHHHHHLWPYPTNYHLVANPLSGALVPSQTIPRKSPKSSRSEMEEGALYAQANSNGQVDHSYMTIDGSMTVDGNAIRPDHVYSTIDSMDPSIDRAQVHSNRSSGREHPSKKGTIVRNTPNGHSVQTYLV